MAYAMLMGAAAAWAITIVTVRGHRFRSSALSLAPWQMLIAATLLLPVAMSAEGLPGQLTLARRGHACLRGACCNCFRLLGRG